MTIIHLLKFVTISGIFYDHLKSYTIVFLSSGAPPIIGAMLMCGIYCIKQKKSLIQEDFRLDSDLTGGKRESLALDKRGQSVLALASMFTNVMQVEEDPSKSLRKRSTTVSDNEVKSDVDSKDDVAEAGLGQDNIAYSEDIPSSPLPYSEKQ